MTLMKLETPMPYRIVSLIALMLMSSSAWAHFPWLSIDKKGNACFFFGENPADTTYKLPPAIAAAELQSIASDQSQPIDTVEVTSDDFVGLKSAEPVDKSTSMLSTTTFGVYRGAKLQYYTQYLGGKMPTSLDDCEPMAGADLQVHAVDVDGGVEIYVMWKGEPLEGADVQLFCDRGHNEGDDTTDDDGKVLFDDQQVEDGLNGIMVGHTLSGVEGQWEGQSFQSEMHYATATFFDPEDE
ncbi:MAG: hypothetical protein AAF670_10250 [Planctomycetota bacterium]